MKPAQDAAVLERAKSLCNEACFIVALQHRRLRSTEPEDDVFIFRWWADLQFLIVALSRLRRSAQIAQSVVTTSTAIHAAIREFDQALPCLKTMRNIGEHVESYAVDDPKRHDKSVGQSQLQVGQWDGTVYVWLGESLNIDVAQDAAQKLLKAVRAC